MRQHAQASPDDIDLGSLAATLRRSAVKLIALSLMAGAVTYLALSLIAPRYMASTELGIVSRGGNNPFVAPGSQPSTETVSLRMDEKAVNTHVRALQSTDLLEKLAGEMQLAERPEFNPALGPVDTMGAILRALGLANPQMNLSDTDRVLNEIGKRLVVYAPKDSRTIAIDFSSVDPQLAADFANRLADNYRERLATATVAETTTVQEKIAPQISRLQAEVLAAEERVAAFRNSAGLLRGGSQKTPINEQELGDLTSEMTRVKSQRTAAESRARAARDLMRRGTPEVIPEVQRAPLVQNLIAQRVSVERELLRRSASLKEAHPVMRQLRADLSAVNRQIAGEIANVVSSLDKEAFLAAEQEAAVMSSLEKVKSTVAVNTTDEVELRRLETMANAKRAELERLQAQFESNRARSENGAVPVEAQILSPARPPSLPYFPKKMPFALLAMVATLLIGTALVITVGLARGARGGHGHRSVEPAAPAATADRDRLRSEIAAVAAMPPPPARPSTATSATPDDIDDGAFVRVDSAEALADRLVESSRTASGGFRTLIACDCDLPTSGRITLDSARALGRSGKQTVVIDWNLEGSGIARHFRMPSAPGFVELLKGTSSFSDVVRWIPDTAVHFIPSGWAFAEGPDGLDADQLNLILDALDEAYDHIVVVGRYEAARNLFEAIQGRFDAGVLAMGPTEAGRVLTEPPGTFLGFEVADIELIRLETKILRPGNAA